jgi:hypothetical protein
MSATRLGLLAVLRPLVRKLLFRVKEEAGMKRGQGSRGTKDGMRLWPQAAFEQGASTRMQRISIRRVCLDDV